MPGNCVLSARPMFDTRPYALIVDSDEESRARIAALLRESGFVTAAFRDGRGALAALAVRPVDLAVLAGRQPGGADALAAARQIRHCRPGVKLLFTGAAGTIPAEAVDESGCAVTRPFDRRRLLAAVFALLTPDARAAEQRDAAEYALMAARHACLRSRLTGAGHPATGHDIARQIELALARRQTPDTEPASA